MNGGTDPLWQAQDMDSENFRGARLIPKTEIESTFDNLPELTPEPDWNLVKRHFRRYGNPLKTAASRPPASSQSVPMTSWDTPARWQMC